MIYACIGILSSLTEFIILVKIDEMISLLIIRFDKMQG